MNLLQIVNKSEMRFWEYFIPLLESEAAVLKKFINIGYFSYQRYKPMSFVYKSFFWASLGLIFGLVIGIFIA